LLRAKSGTVLEAVGYLKEALEAAEDFPIDQPAILMGLVGAHGMYGAIRNAREFAVQYFNLAAESSDPAVRSYLPKVWFNLGYCYDSASQFRDAVECYCRAHEIALQNPEWLNPGLPAHNLVQVYLELGRTDDALLMLQEARDHLEEAVWGAYWKDQQAQSLLALGWYQEAEAACGEALAHPACDETVLAEAHLTLARIYLAQNQVEEAITYANKAHDLSLNLLDTRLINKIEELQTALKTTEEVPEQ
jgi:tetratricopeptide (TPR) repeat protein